MDILSTIWYTSIGLFSKVFLGGLIIYGVYLMFLFTTKQRKTLILKKCVAEFILCCYFAALFNLTGILELRFTDFSGMHAMPNLIPLINTMQDFFNYGVSVLKQITLNIILFIPFGVLSSILICKNKKYFIRIVTLAFIISGGIEIIQYFCGRYADIDDVIWNTMGASIGYLMYTIYIKLRKNIK